MTKDARKLRLRSFISTNAILSRPKPTHVRYCGDIACGVSPSRRGEGIHSSLLFDDSMRQAGISARTDAFPLLSSHLPYAVSLGATMARLGKICNCTSSSRRYLSTPVGLLLLSFLPFEESGHRIEKEGAEESQIGQSVVLSPLNLYPCILRTRPSQQDTTGSTSTIHRLGHKVISLSAHWIHKTVVSVLPSIGILFLSLIRAPTYPEL